MYDGSENHSYDVSSIKNQVFNKIRDPEERQGVNEPIKIGIESTLRRKYWLAAASIALTMGLIYIYSALNPQLFVNDDDVAWNEIRTGYGERKVIKLTDRSTVTINGKSHFRYPTRFNENHRTVSIDGEAYFKVTKDKNRPFSVLANDTKTTVLGTEFNIKNHPEDSMIAISLIEGSVQVDVKDSLSETTFTLVPNQEMVLNKINGEADLRQFDFWETTGWKENVFVFKDASLDEVIEKLSKHFGITITLANRELEEFKIRGKYSGKTAREVLENIFKFSDDCVVLEEEINKNFKLKVKPCNQ